MAALEGKAVIQNESRSRSGFERLLFPIADIQSNRIKQMCLPGAGRRRFRVLLAPPNWIQSANVEKKTPQKAASSVRASGYGSALVAAHVAELLLGRHPLNHLRGIVTFGVQFERNPIVADGRLVGALGHDGLSEGIPCVGR